MPVRFDAHEFHEGLVKHGLIIPVGVPGVFGRSAVFEDVLERFNGLVSEVSKHDGAEVYTFPPVINRQVLEKVHYLDSFPHLCGAVYSFFGKEPQAKELSRRIHDGEKWDDLLGLTDVVLNPAACYPVYPTMTGTVPRRAAGDHAELGTRQQPSPEPTRMQSFRVREFVRIGTPAEVLEWRDMWLQRQLTLLRSPGLPAGSEVVSDPFFGRSGKMLAVSQKEQRLKFEVVIPVISAENPTAVCSFNFHQEHFGSTFGIRTSDDQVANSACLGFGLERIAQAALQDARLRPWRVAAGSAYPTAALVRRTHEQVCRRDVALLHAARDLLEGALQDRQHAARELVDQELSAGRECGTGLRHDIGPDYLGHAAQRNAGHDVLCGRQVEAFENAADIGGGFVGHMQPRISVGALEELDEGFVGFDGDQVCVRTHPSQDLPP